MVNDLLPGISLEYAKFMEGHLQELFPADCNPKQFIADHKIHTWDSPSKDKSELWMDGCRVGTFSQRLEGDTYTFEFTKMKWKTDIVKYTCEIIRGKVNLMIGDYHVGRHPLSYTFEECIEEFCEKVGWDFNIATQEQRYPTNRVTGHISFQRPHYPSVLETVENYYFRLGRRNDEH